MHSSPRVIEIFHMTNHHIILEDTGSWCIVGRTSHLCDMEHAQSSIQQLLGRHRSFLGLAYAAVEGLILVLHQGVKHVARGIHHHRSLPGAPSVADQLSMSLDLFVLPFVAPTRHKCPMPMQHSAEMEAVMMLWQEPCILICILEG